MANGSNPVYLDYNATTPLAPQVVEAITQSLTDQWANPSSSYQLGQVAKKAIEASRQHVAEMISASTEDIIFTSGGTECNHIAIHSVLNHCKRTKQEIRLPLPHIISSSIEHDSVLKTLKKLESDGSIELTLCSPVNGRVTIERILDSIKPQTVLISVMLANNETGVIQPLKELSVSIAKYNKENDRLGLNRIFIHTDAAQAIGKIPVSVSELGVDYLTVVGQKFYGPRIAALYVRGLVNNYTPYSHPFSGGGQERGYRPGTENTPLIVGLGQAAKLVTEHIDKYSSHMSSICQYLESKLKEKYGETVHFNSHFPGASSLPNTCNVSLNGSNLFKGAEILRRLKLSQVSLGAACHTSKYSTEASVILLESGVPEEIATNALRVSIGRDTTVNDIDVFLKDLNEAVEDILKTQ